MTDALRIAVVHYHLRPGGVTSVIASAARALEERDVELVVLADGPDPLPRLPHAAALVPELNYAEPDSALPPTALIAGLRKAARRALGADPDVWHIHNHTLGKNCALTAAVREMADSGQKILLQIHDFPEDGRPVNYATLLNAVGTEDSRQLGAVLYPLGNHVHYAVLNPRDHRILKEAGFPAERLHLLPNPVPADHFEKLKMREPGGDAPRLFLYPTRAIRRKNLGEFLLWSALAPPGDRFASTLAPTGAADVASYNRWIAFAREAALPVEFGIGMKKPIPLPRLYANAHAVVTTSIAEGFGLAFVEPWLAHRPLLGRDIPDITGGFKKEGLDLSGLYAELTLPAAWIDRNALRRRIELGYRHLLSNYGRMPKPDECKRAEAAVLVDDRVDFGRLDEEFQREVISRLIRNPAARTELTPSSLPDREAAAPVITANRRCVERTHSLKSYGKKLQAIYQSLAGAEPSAIQTPDATRILDAFLSPEHFRLLRT